MKEKKKGGSAKRGVIYILLGIFVTVSSIFLPELLEGKVDMALDQLATISNVVFVVGLTLIGAGIVNIVRCGKKEKEKCPKCGAKTRRTRTFIERRAGRTGNWWGNAGNRRRDTPYYCYYDLTWECKCGWSKEERNVRKSAGKYVEFENGDFADYVQEPLADFDTGWEK